MTLDDRFEHINTTCSALRSCPSHPISEQPCPSLWFAKFPTCHKSTLHHRYLPTGEPIIFSRSSFGEAQFCTRA
jgi:hypothetical protein